MDNNGGDSGIMRLLDERDRRYEAHFESLSTALQLQASEYERRLEALNHDHARAQETALTYLATEKYEDARLSDSLAWKTASARLDERLQVLETWKSRAAGVATVAVPLLVLAGGLIGKAVG